jgi:hypothetical protein
MKRYAYLGALFFPLTVCAQGSPSAAAPELSAAPGWHKIPGTALKGGPENTSPCPPNGYAGSGYPFLDACQAVYNAWSSGVADTTRNRLIIWGGGHGDYAGNEIYSLEMTTNPPKLIRLDPPSPPNTARSPCPSPEALTDGRPNSRHTYDSLAYLPEQDQMIGVGGGVGLCGYGSNGAWTLKMSSVVASCAPECTPSWTRVGAGPSGYGFITAWDSADHVYWLNDQNNLWSFNPATNSWAKHGPGAANNFNATGVYDPVDQYFINVGLNAGGGQSIVYYKVGRGSNYRQLNPGVDASCAGAVAAAYPGVAWDPIEGVAVVYPNGGNVLYLLNPKNWTCTKETYGSKEQEDYPQSNPRGSNGTFKRFSYLPALDLFVLCNDPYNDCWYLRRRRSEGKAAKSEPAR